MHKVSERRGFQQEIIEGALNFTSARMAALVEATRAAPLPRSARRCKGASLRFSAIFTYGSLTVQFGGRV